MRRLALVLSLALASSTAGATMLLLGAGGGSGGGGGGGGGGPTEVLTSQNDHSNAAWTKEYVTFTGSQTDKDGGSTAELMLETADTNNHQFYQGGITVTTGRLVGTVYYKQYAGTPSTRKLDIQIYGASSGGYIVADKDCASSSSGVWGTFTSNSIAVTSSTGGYCKVTIDIQVDVTTVTMFARILESGVNNYAGNTSYGWYIDDHSLLDY